jgi:hypothetical protein
VAWQYTKNGNEWYLIENRRQSGRDANVPDHGLALWHIDTTGNNSNEDMLPGSHYYVTLVQADGDWDMENNVNIGDNTDCYAAPTFTAATPCTDPNTDWWDGTESALSITNISTSQATMTFDFSDEDNDPVAQAVTYFSAEADDECCIEVSVEDIDSLSYDPDGPGDISTLCITHVDGVDVGCNLSVEVCGEGEHTVRLTITDLCGNTSYDETTVDVIDNTPPEIAVELDRDALWPPNHKMVEVCATVTATDNCDDSLTVALVSVTSDEPDNDKADGNTINDIQNASTGTEDLCFDLRSERQGTGDGRTYEIIYSATDNAGNTSYDSVTVDVPHDQGANAFASTGFNALGTALRDVNSFAVFLLGSETLDVTRIERESIYAGNTGGAVLATRSRELDINTDGFLDLAAFFDHLSPSELTVIRMEEDPADNTGAVDTKTISNGPVGVHFMSDDESYLVSNIYGLGAPIDMPATREKDVVDPHVLTPPATGDKTAITAVYPNPFNPQTSVHFTLASPVRVKIAIFDVTGALVRGLVDDSLPAGSHEARWDGRTDKGNGATSGIYFVRMVAGSHTEVRKIVMLK